MSLAGDLCDYLVSFRGAQFNWANCNCATFSAGWVRKATGRDALAGLEADSARSWALIVRERRGMRQTVSARLGAQEQLPTMARVGDLVLMPSAPGEVFDGGMLGICCGRTVACLAKVGLVHLERAQALCAWHLSEVAP